MSEEKSWEKMTMGEQMGAARIRQASFRLEADVRRAAKARDLNAKEAEGLLEKARVAFVFVNGEAQGPSRTGPQWSPDTGEGPRGCRSLGSAGFTGRFWRRDRSRPPSLKFPAQ
jgi:hypothetical protein